MAESSTKPYLIRALYEWCCDNGYTPYLAVVVDRHTLVPRQHVKNGEIVLNVSPMATNHMQMGNELIEFQARFSGVAQQLSIPVENVAAIYARETGHGMAFEVARPAPVEEGAEDAALPGEGSIGDDAMPEAAADADQDDSPAADAEDGTPAPGTGRKRAGKGQGGADVIAFASPGGGRGKREPGARSGAAGKAGVGVKPPGAAGGEAAAAGSDTDTAAAGVPAAPAKGGRPAEKHPHEGGANGKAADSAGNAQDDHDEPPPAPGGKGGRTRLTRVK